LGAVTDLHPPSIDLEGVVHRAGRGVSDEGPLPDFGPKGMAPAYCALQDIVVATNDFTNETTRKTRADLDILTAC
tara:strand:+ start:73 stop:297 length:225 start_codon:yes stop_codon:yes gene_type:complete